MAVAERSAPRAIVLQGLNATIVGCKNKRGVSAGSFRIYIRALVQEKFYDFGEGILGAEHEKRFTFAIPFFEIETRPLQKIFQNLDVTGSSCAEERIQGCGARVHRAEELRIGTFFHKELGDFTVAGGCGKDKRGVSVPCLSIHVGATGDQEFEECKLSLSQAKERMVLPVLLDV